MTTAFEIMLTRVGKTKADVRPRSALGKVFRRKGVEDGPELERIRHLPRRRWQEDPDLPGLVRDLTAWLKTPAGAQTLRPVQAKALEEMHDFGGLLAPIGCGDGKTLITALAPVVVGARRPLLLVLAKLRDKTRREFAALAKNWRVHPRIAILSYDEISREGGWEKLCAIDPDWILADECQRLKNRDAGVTRKIARWFREKPETRFVPTSGTITTRSLRDYGHLSKWALRDLSPLPERADQLAEWADAVDEKVPPDRRIAPGKLLCLCDDAEVSMIASDAGAALACVREGFGRRLRETPGVVATNESGVACSLQISAMRYPGEPSDMLAAAFRRLRREWETPDGHPFSEASELWRHARSLSLGMYYRWDPAAPEEWMTARREWARFVRDMLSRRRNDMDTELQVAKACARQELPDSQYRAWTTVRDTFKPNSVPVWIDERVLQAAAAWASEGPGIVWTEHVAVGERLSEITGLPYFGAGGTCKGKPIEEAQGAVIASVASNCEGRNLQRWSRNLVLSAPPNGKILEQLFARTHRQGQEADEVSVDMFVGCRETWQGLNQAMADARYIQSTTGQPQRLCYADVDLMDADEAAALIRRPDPLWEETA
jgi:hypothetical protein